MNRREFSKRLLLAGGAIALAPNLAWAAEGGPALEAIKQRGALRIGVFNGTAPYYQKNLATGEWAGFCVDMGRDLASYMGVELDLVETTWGNAVLDLQADKIDVMFALSKNPERAKTIDFSKPLMDNTFTALSRADLAFATWAEIDRPEIRVAVDLGSTQDAFARKALPNATLVALKGAEETILALSAGRADVVIQVALLAVVTAKKLGPRFKLTVPEPQSSQPTTIGVRRDPNGEFRDYVDGWLAKRRADGKVSEWIVASLQLVGVTREMLPANLTF